MLARQMEELISPQARAKRLKELRRLAKLTLQEMAEGGQINYNTLCGWESAKHGGLTEKGALKVVERLKDLGVECSIEWLMYGTGMQPKSSQLIMSAKKLTSTTQLIQEQSEVLKKMYSNMIQLLLADDAMLPDYQTGDFLAGLAMPLSALYKANGQNIIACLAGGETVLRKFYIQPATGSILLLAQNLKYNESLLADPLIEAWALPCYQIKHSSI